MEEITDSSRLLAHNFHPSPPYATLPACGFRSWRRSGMKTMSSTSLR